MRFNRTRDFVALARDSSAAWGGRYDLCFLRSSLVQLNTPDDVSGRVSAISGLAISTSSELGEMQSGLAAALLGVTGAVVFGGVGAIVITAAWAWIFPELLRAKTFEPQFRQRESRP